MKLVHHAGVTSIRVELMEGQGRTVAAFCVL